ncbi:MAG: hypothetical protein LBS00_01615 [Synergistaceae bacterium]|jgi:LuxR family maltose regulon positive regulatory protein|nr:hypothetical protein [Synergistaceae bacterium]
MLLKAGGSFEKDGRLERAEILYKKSLAAARFFSEAHPDSLGGMSQVADSSVKTWSYACSTPMNSAREGRGVGSRHDAYYFLEHLKARLAKIPDYPVTFVEAPSGFGKTTAVREYLKDLGHTLGVSSFWHICLGEPPVKTWSGICKLFSNVSAKMAVSLKELGVPTMETIADVAEIARSYRASSETFLVVDNYQLFDCEIRKEIAEAFSTHGDHALHVIFITQPIDFPVENLRGGFDVHHIAAGDLLFSKEDVSRYSQMMGVALSDDEHDRLFLLTEGWIAVVSLQLMNFREHGTFVYGKNCDAFVEKAVWNRLSADERNFLLSVSLLDSFSPAQAVVMHGAGNLPEDILRLLERKAARRRYS